MTKEPFVPNRPGFWWRYDLAWQVVEVSVIHGSVIYGNGQLRVKDDGLWGGPVIPPDWTPLARRG
jgi:hypothetical protein